MSHEEYLVLTFLLVQVFLVNISYEPNDGSDTVETRDQIRYTCAMK